MNIRKVIQRRLRHESGGVDLAGGVNAVISANVNEPGTVSRVSSTQRIVERSGSRAVADETSEKAKEDTPDE
jgi:hypothetical protein